MFIHSNNKINNTQRSKCTYLKYLLFLSMLLMDTIVLSTVHEKVPGSYNVFINLVWPEEIKKKRKNKNFSFFNLYFFFWFWMHPFSEKVVLKSWEYHHFYQSCRLDTSMLQEECSSSVMSVSCPLKLSSTVQQRGD